jgi:ABC-type multidrug transport system ATPase subunit
VNPLLEANALEVRFGDLFSVGPVSFSMGPGLLYVAGPNGGGKTTLLRALAGELLPSQGEVQVNGNIVHKSVTARRQIALVPSIPELPGFLTVAEAYQFAASLRQAPSWDGSPFCEQLSLDQGLPLANASAGQRRKAELVCALAGDPPVLLLDETFAHLDNQSCARLQGWLAEWSKSRLIVLTHHGGPPVSVSATLAVDRDHIDFSECPENESLEQSTRE